MACQVKSTWLNKKQNQKNKIFKWNSGQGLQNNDFSGKQQTENTWILPGEMVPVPQSSCLYKRRGKKAAGLR